MKTTRRTFLGAVSAASFLAAIPDCHAEVATTSLGVLSPLEPWKPGNLDIHHISTGRGNATLAIAPDGTAILIDAGAIYDPLLYTISPRPDSSKRPGEWIARYIQRHLAPAKRVGLDYVVLTHFHGDHIGQYTDSLPVSSNGNYSLTGITDVAECVPISEIIDRGYPHYSYPAPLSDATYLNYKRFIDLRTSAGKKVSALDVGSDKQIVLRYAPHEYSNFRIEGVAANGIVARSGQKKIDHFPPVDHADSSQPPSENMCSVALRLSFGDFAYYTGGDLTNDTDFGRAPWRDIESPVAKAVGCVTVAVANHHGYVNGMGACAVESLRPQIFVIFAWDSAHPTISPLFNMLSRELYPEDRSVYATSVKAENVIATRDISKMNSISGHVVIRVTEGGGRYQVIVVDDSNELDHVRMRSAILPTKRG